MKTYAPARPGAPVTFPNTKPTYVVERLESLQGPRDGVVRLPLHLDWTAAAGYDLTKPKRLCSMYSTVLREAMSERDLIDNLNRELLVSVWRDLKIPSHIRDAWESLHGELRWC